MIGTVVAKAVEEQDLIDQRELTCLCTLTLNRGCYLGVFRDERGMTGVFYVVPLSCL